MKRLIMILLALCLCLSFVACNEGGETTTEADNKSEAPAESGEPTGEVTEAPGSDEVTEPAFTGYKVTVTDKDGNPISGVQIQMCDSNGCKLPKGTGEDGTVTFDYETSDFHVLIAATVEGYAVDTTEEYYFTNGSKELTIELEKAA